MDYLAPTTVEEATKLLSETPGAKVFAGATDVIPQIRAGRPEPEALVDLKKIDRLTSVATTDSGYLDDRGCGADRQTHRRRRAHRSTARTRGSGWPHRLRPDPEPMQPRRQPVQRLAGRRLGPGHDRERCTGRGGEQRQYPHHPGGRRGHRARPALAGRGRVRGGIRGRQAPGQYRRRLPPDDPTHRDGHRRGGGWCPDHARRRRHCASATIALGAVAPTAVRVPAAEEALVGQPINDDTLAAVAAAASDACNPIDDKRGTIAYRRQVAGVLAKRAVRAAAERAANGGNS